MKRVTTDLTKRNRKMLLTINNPVFTHEELHEIIEKNVKGSGYYYCYSFEVGLKEKTPHCHIYFVFENARYGNTIKKIFPTSHIDYCNGTNQSVRDYIFKEGKWANTAKEDTRIDGTQFENKTLPAEEGQGHRSDLDYIEQLINEGKTPREILDLDFGYYKYENMIKKAYYNKRFKETAVKRNVDVIVHVGVSGSGKSNIVTSLDENNMCIFADYTTALFDNYNGEDTVIFDEFRGQIAYNQLLLILDGYKVPIHARYTNIYSLWNTVHITSVIAVEDWYNNNNIRDTFVQLKRRIGKIVYHFMTDKYNNFIADKDEFLIDHDSDDIVYHEYEINAREYTTYAELEKKALSSLNVKAPDLFGINNGEDIELERNLFDFI